MSNIHDTIVPTRASALRYVPWFRLQDILVLQGSPLLGAAFAIGHPRLVDLGPLSMLLIANLFLVAHIFMINDWSGVTIDLADPNKTANVFTARGVGRREMAALTVGLLLLSLALFGALGRTTLALAVGIATLSALYSLPQFNWKGRPFLNSATHLAGGILHFLLGYSAIRPIDVRSLAFATFFGLLFAAGHLTQEIRDHSGDAAHGIRTNAVVFGQRRTFGASLGLFTLAQVLLLTLALEGALPRPIALLIALYPLQLWWSLQTLRAGFTYTSVERLQFRYRLLYALIGLAIVFSLWLG